MELTCSHSPRERQELGRRTLGTPLVAPNESVSWYVRMSQAREKRQTRQKRHDDWYQAAPVSCCQTAQYPQTTTSERLDLLCGDHIAILADRQEPPRRVWWTIMFDFPCRDDRKRLGSTRQAGRELGYLLSSKHKARRTSVLLIHDVNSLPAECDCHASFSKRFGLFVVSVCH